LTDWRLMALVYKLRVREVLFPIIFTFDQNIVKVNITKCNKLECHALPTRPADLVPRLHETGHSVSHKHSCAVGKHQKQGNNTEKYLNNVLL